MVVQQVSFFFLYRVCCREEVFRRVTMLGPRPCNAVSGARAAYERHIAGYITLPTADTIGLEVGNRTWCEGRWTSLSGGCLVIPQQSVDSNNRLKLERIFQVHANLLFRSHVCFWSVRHMGQTSSRPRRPKTKARVHFQTTASPQHGSKSTFPLHLALPHPDHLIMSEGRA